MSTAPDSDAVPSEADLAAVFHCTSDELPEGEVLSRSLHRVPVAVARHEGRLFAFGALCPHAHADMSTGILEPGGAISCEVHLWRFDLTSGRCTMMDDAVLPTWNVTEEDGAIRVDLRRTTNGTGR